MLRCHEILSALAAVWTNEEQLLGYFNKRQVRYASASDKCEIKHGNWNGMDYHLSKRHKQCHEQHTDAAEERDEEHRI